MRLRATLSGDVDSTERTLSILPIWGKQSSAPVSARQNRSDRPALSGPSTWYTLLPALSLGHHGLAVPTKIGARLAHRGRVLFLPANRRTLSIGVWGPAMAARVEQIERNSVDNTG
jgi:hypothetical protein